MDAPSYDYPSLCVNIFSVIVSAVIAIAAIWGDWLRYLATPPRLSVCLRRRILRIERINAIEHRFIHLEVQNSNRWYTATNVDVNVVRIDRQQADGHWEIAYDVGPIPLKWQFSVYDIRRNDIGPVRYCDLAVLRKNGCLELETRFAPADFDRKISPNQGTRVHIVAIADNVTSDRLVLELHWDGIWSDDDSEMAGHIVVRPISKCYVYPWIEG